LRFEARIGIVRLKVYRVALVLGGDMDIDAGSGPGEAVELEAEHIGQVAALMHEEERGEWRAGLSGNGERQLITLGQRRHALRIVLHKGRGELLAPREGFQRGG